MTRILDFKVRASALAAGAANVRWAAYEFEMGDAASS
jgi:hypothetical protein